MKAQSCLAFLVAMFGAMSLAAAPSKADTQYKFIKEIPIGGGSGWDYLFADAVGRRLYVTHGTKIVVIDLDADKIVGEILDTPGVHGFVSVPDLKRGFSSNGQENKASIVDLETLKTAMKVPTGGNPDAICYDPAAGEVYTFNGRGKSATVFEAKTGKVVATIPLDGKPETGVCDPDAGRIYVNIEDKSTVAVIDAKTHQVVATWPIEGGEGPSGLVIKPDLHRLFIGCGNEKAIMMDSTNGKIVASIPCGQGVDACGVDPGTGLFFVSAGGSGTVTIAKLEGDNLNVIQTLPTERGARTMTVDAKTHRIYLSNAKSRTDLNSFKVLVYGMEP
ncbi:MAG: YncE family protein [Planctomycetota bacterium]|nr:YncE family protein [Planctomycetota bacterium]